MIFFWASSPWAQLSCTWCHWQLSNLQDMKDQEESIPFPAVRYGNALLKNCKLVPAGSILDHWEKAFHLRNKFDLKQKRVCDEAGELAIPGTSPASKSLWDKSFTFCMWLHVCTRRKAGLKLFPPTKSIFISWAWLQTVYQVLHLHYNSPSLFPEQKRMQWVELLILFIWQVAQLIWRGKRKKAATHASQTAHCFITHSL